MAEFRYKPGGLEARQHGCSCDKTQNGYGGGLPLEGGRRAYVVDKACPHHGEGTQWGESNGSLVIFQSERIEIP